MSIFSAGRRLCILVALSIGAANPCAAQVATTLHYAGFAFGGQAQDADHAFPVSYALSKETEGPGAHRLDRELGRRLKGQSFPGISIDEGLGNSKTGDSLAIAFVLNWENVAQERIGNDFKLTVDLRAEALVFDFEKMKVIAAYPFGFQTRDVSATPPTPAKIQGMVRGMYLSGDRGIFDLFIKALTTSHIKRSYGAYAQVVDVNLEDKAVDTLASFGADQGQLKSLIADTFNADLSQNAAIPVLPYTKGQAIGGKMSARFSNGEVFNLALPEPDYRIRLTVRGFKKVEIGSTASETAFAYASFFHVAVIQPLRGSPYLDGDFKFAAAKTVPKAVITIDDWAAYQESMLSLLDGLTKQFASPDSRWIEKWGTDGELAQVQTAAQALVRCR